MRSAVAAADGNQVDPSRVKHLGAVVPGIDDINPVVERVGEIEIAEKIS
jgi:hypothetical protein